VIFVHGAQAREQHRHGFVFARYDAAATAYRDTAAAAFAWTTQGADRGAYQGGFGPRPAAWCGWQMRQLVGSDPGPEFNLARNWARWGHAGPAGIGAVVVWARHVGKIVGQENGTWLIQSGNDDHQLRTRPLSISGAIAIRWG
jgi:hypothetical protein